MKSKWIVLLLAVALPACALAQGAAMPGSAWTMQGALGTQAAEEERYLRQWELYDAAASAATVQEGMDVLRDAVAASPGDVDTYLVCAQARFWADAMDEYAELSYQWLEAALELARGEKVLEVATEYVDQLMYAGEDQAAVDMLLRVMREHGETEPLQLLLATALQRVDTDGAFAVLDELLEYSPVSFDAQVMRAQLLVDTCRWDEALAAYRQIDVDWPEYMAGMYGQYVTYYGSGEFEKAARMIDQMLMLAESEDDLWMERANLRLWRQHRPQQAIEEAEALLRVHSDWTEAAALKAMALCKAGAYAQSRQMAWKIAEMDPEYGQLLLVYVDISEGKWADARARALNLKQKSGGFQSLYTTLSEIYLEGFDDAETAIEVLAEAFDPGYGDGYAERYLCLGKAYQRQQAYQEAARAYAAADVRAYMSAEPLQHLVMLYIEAGRAEDMLQTMEEMERRYPGWEQTMLTRVRVESVLGNGEAALAAFAQYKVKFPFPAEAMRAEEAVLMARAGDAQGVEILSEQADGTPQALESLAQARLALDDLPGALEALDAADAQLAAEPDGETPRTLRASLLGTRAQLMLEMGKIDEGVALYRQAAELDWPLHALALRADYETLLKNEAFAEMMAAQKSAWGKWDLTVLPRIPQAQ